MTQNKSSYENFGNEQLQRYLCAIALSLLARRQLAITHQLVEKITQLGPPSGALPDYLAALSLQPQGRALNSLQWRTLLEQAAHIAELASEQDISLVTLFCDDYPPLLAEIADPPPLLYVRGARRLLRQPQLAVVGSRKSQPPTLQLVEQWCRSMAAAGVTITSGLALGVDGAAHRGAVAAQQSTLAVMATGFDQLYPPRHCNLAEQIVAAGGALVTEFAPGEKPLAANFPRRNRIISGLSLAVWVVEAAIKSGTLITARTALEQNREVLALPGSVNNPLTRGCHQLLRDGARLVENAAEIVSLLGANFRVESSVEQSYTPVQEKLLAALGYDLVSLDIIAERCGWPVAEVARLLAELELTGGVSRQVGGWQRC
ncbi:MAG: DNA-processing protein DprA [Porticoccaceae bacterium]